jgi:hypothetical protein
MTDRQQETVKALKWVAIGSIISEYGALLLPQSRGEVKMRVNGMINASKKLQSYFVNNHQASPEARSSFKTEFSKNEIVLISELIETVWGIPEADLEAIVNTLKENIVDHAG